MALSDYFIKQYYSTTQTVTNCSKIITKKIYTEYSCLIIIKLVTVKMQNAFKIILFD